jgi:hypothetical protein
VTYGDITLDVTRMEVRYENRVLTMWVDRDGKMWVDSKLTGDGAPKPTPSPKQP